MRFRPCIDIHNGQVKQIVGSTLNSQAQTLQTNFVAQKPAVYFAELYKKDGLIGGHIIMLDNVNTTKKQALEALTIFPGGMEIGGGVTLENALNYLDNGAGKVIVSSYIFTDNKLDLGKLDKLSKLVGKDRLVLDLSCRRQEKKYIMVKDKWQTFTDLIVNKESLKLLANYCAKFLIHGVDSEGKRQGIEKDLVEMLGRWSPLPVTYAGGVKNFADIDLIYQLGKGKIDFTIGSALDIFGGDLKYEEVLKYLQKYVD